MKVKIGDKIYSSDEEPIMLILNEEDRRDLANMAPDALAYCVYPKDKLTVEEIREFMSTAKDLSLEEKKKDVLKGNNFPIDQAEG